MNKNNKNNKGYIFLSHSHKDLDKVRKIRNLFEENNIEPILFYLRCMDNPDSNEAKILEELIHKEIDARDFVVYAKSNNSENSKWVQNELAYIKNTKPQNIKTITLDKKFTSIQNDIEDILKNRRIVTINFNHDNNILDKFSSYFIKKDYMIVDNVVIPNNISGCLSDWWAELSINIPENISFVIFASKYFIEKNILLKQLEVLRQYKNINIYVILFDCKISGNLEQILQNVTFNNINFIETSSNLSENELWFLTQEIRSGQIECPWGPERTTFTEKNRPNYAVFNSLINNKIIGDERNFVRIKDVNAKEYKNAVFIQPGHIYDVIIYYHNNSNLSNAKKPEGIANNVIVTSNFPSTIDKDEILTINAQIKSQNCNPPVVWGGCYVLSESKCKITYIEGSACIENNGKINGESVGAKYLFSDGSSIGYNSFSGIIPGGYEYSGFVKYKLIVETIDN